MPRSSDLAITKENQLKKQELPRTKAKCSTSRRGRNAVGTAKPQAVRSSTECEFIEDPSAHEGLLMPLRRLVGMIGWSREEITQAAARGEFPAPVRIGRKKRWDWLEIERWFKADCPSRKEWETTKGGKT